MNWDLADMLASLFAPSGGVVKSNHHVIADVHHAGDNTPNLTITDPVTHQSHALEPGFNNTIMQVGPGHVVHGYLHSTLNGGISHSSQPYGAPDVVASPFGHNYVISDGLGKPIGMTHADPFSSETSFNPFYTKS